MRCRPRVHVGRADQGMPHGLFPAQYAEQMPYRLHLRVGCHDHGVPPQVPVHPDASDLHAERRPLQLQHNEQRRQLLEEVRGDVLLQAALLCGLALHVGYHDGHLPFQLHFAHLCDGLHSRSDVPNRYVLMHCEVQRALHRRAAMRRRQRMRVGLAPRRVQSELRQV